MTIWKKELQIADVQYLDVPAGARLLTVQTQNGSPCAWFFCDPDARMIENGRRVSMYGTGHPMPSVIGKYLGTFQLADGTLVFHAFDSTGLENER